MLCATRMYSVLKRMVLNTTAFPELCSELNRALGKPFIFAMLGTMLCVLFGAFSEVLAIYMMDKPTTILWAHQGVTIKALGSDAILFAAPILATIPYAGAFVDDASLDKKATIIRKNVLQIQRFPDELVNSCHVFPCSLRLFSIGIKERRMLSCAP